MTGANDSLLIAHHRNWLVRIGAIVIVLGLVGVLTTVLSRPSATAPSTVIKPEASATLRLGDRLPTSPRLPELVGRSVTSIGILSAHRPTVINFFASFCTACAAEMRTFGSVAHSDPGVSFIGVDTNEPNVGSARSMVEHSGVDYPVLKDNAALTLANSYGIANLPTTFFVNAKGKITAEFLGSESASQLRSDIATT